MRSSSQELKTASKVDEIFNVIGSISKSEKKHVSTESEDVAFSCVCEITKKLNTSEFADLEERLLLFLIREWDKTNCCFVTLEFIADLFSYICSNASDCIVQEYLHYFSQPSMPPHIRLILYPAILVIANRRFPDRPFPCSFMGIFEKCLLNLSDDVENSANEFVLFWKGATRYYLVRPNSVEFNRKLLTAFLTSRHWFEKLCVIDEHRIAMFNCLTPCLFKKPLEETSILLTSLFVIFLQSLTFNEKSWNRMASFLFTLHSTASRHPDAAVIEFVSTVINSFINCVQVASEDLLKEFRVSLIHVIPAISIPASKAEKSQINENGNENVPKSLISPFSKPPQCIGPSSVHTNGNDNSSGVTFQTKDMVTTRLQQAPEKTLDLLQRLIMDLKESKVKFTLESDRLRLETVIKDLSTLL